MSKQSNYRLLKELLLIVALSSIMAYIMGISNSQEWRYMWKRFVITFIIWLVLWYGNKLVSYLMDSVYSWLKNPGKRFILGIISSAIYSGLAMLALIWVFNSTVGISITDNAPITIFFTMIFSILVWIVLLAKHFLLSWRGLAIQEEKLKNEVLVSKFESLKSQVNPHFMFNSLNTLTSLIYQDQDFAAKYVGQLSKVYRSVLTSGKNEIVTIEEELKILESYIFLQTIRFEDRFEVKINLDDMVQERCIPPMVLQMLIENCIKHNEITKENPLVIEVFNEGEMICVKNKIAKKQVLPGDNSAIGIANIRARYEVLSDISIEVLNNGKVFEVKLPLLTLE